LGAANSSGPEPQRRVRPARRTIDLSGAISRIRQLRISANMTSVGELVGIVGKVEQSLLVTPPAERAIAPGDRLAGAVDHLDHLVVLEVDDHRLATLDEEGVIGAVGVRQALEVILPQDLLLRTDQQQPIIAAVGDQHIIPAKGSGVVGNRHGRLRRESALLGRHPSYRRRRAGLGSGGGTLKDINDNQA